MAQTRSVSDVFAEATNQLSSPTGGLDSRTIQLSDGVVVLNGANLPFVVLFEAAAGA